MKNLLYGSVVLAGIVAVRELPYLTTGSGLMMIFLAVSIGLIGIYLLQQGKM